MSQTRIIETFNTHLMRSDVVAAVATGRDAERKDVMEAIRDFLDHPDEPPQHVILYGERGSGKSFLMRIIEIEIGRLVQEEGSLIACALLPEEHPNIKYLHQLLQAIAAKVRGADWSASGFTFDFRPPAEAWDSAVEDLHAALDERFGTDRGVVVAMIENFDVLVREFFGQADVVGPGRGGETPKSAALESRVSEQRLRRLMNAKRSRFMIIAGATGTVDMDYDRPLFLAFKTIDLTPWDGSACIDYFNRRRAIGNWPALTLPEEARGRAIAEFIGGNPRLAQLLADILDSPNAHTIAQVLDQLSDHLAEYYRKRIKDLPPLSAGVLDALIRQGEPCSLRELANRMGVEQNRIEDAFGYLARARLLTAVAEIGSASTLYRVRDRLFVHFYRRRYGDPNQANNLVPIAELLERFFTAREREAQVRHHLELGEFAEAGVFRRTLRRFDACEWGQFSEYRDGLIIGAPGKLFELVGLAPEEIEGAQTELRDRPDAAVKHWHDSALTAKPLLQRAVALLLKAVALCRYGGQDGVRDTLEEALRIAQTDETTDACIIVLNQMALFIWCLKDELGTLSAYEGLKAYDGFAELLRGSQSPYAKCIAYIGLSLKKYFERNFHEAIVDADMAISLAASAGSVSDQRRALKDKAFCLGALGEYSEAMAACDEAIKLAQQTHETFREIECVRHKAWILYGLKRYAEAIIAAEQAARLAQQASRLNEQVECLRIKAWSLSKLGRDEEAIAIGKGITTLLRHEEDIAKEAISFRFKAWDLDGLERQEHPLDYYDKCIALAKDAKDADGISESCRSKAYLLQKIGRLSEALEAARAAIFAYGDGLHSDGWRKALRYFFSIAAEIPALDLIEYLKMYLEYEKVVDSDLSKDFPLNDVMAGVARAEKWPEFLDCLLTKGWAFASEKHRRPFSRVGEVWAAQVEVLGRDQTFAIVARDISIIVQVMKSILSPSEPGILARDHLPDLLSGLVSKCSDSGFLFDLSNLIVDIFGPAAETEAQRLRSFAAFHAEEQKEKVLQRFDPDLATAVRRLWNLPEPMDSLARLGRRRGR